MGCVIPQNVKNYSKKHRYTIFAAVALSVILIALGAGIALTRTNDPDDTRIVDTEKPQTSEPEAEAKKTAEPKPEPANQWPVTYSLEQAASLTVVVNKKHRLPSSYAPSLQAVAGGNLRPEAANALQKLLNDAQNAGNPMIIVSSYRSYSTQVSTYQYWVDTQGKAEADRSSARPGHSEHQAGLAVDLGNPDGSCRLLACFGSGAAGKWLASNAHKYGFIIRYPDGKEALTGYIYEPWHARYVGVSEATAIKNSGKTMDQYYGVEAGGY